MIEQERFRRIRRRVAALLDLLAVLILLLISISVVVMAILGFLLRR